MTRTGQSSFVKRFFASRWFLAVSLAVAVLFAIGYARAYYQDYKVRQQVTALENEVRSLEKKKLESMEVLNYVMSDRFVEEKARTELNMKKPGEHVLLLGQDQAVSPKPMRETVVETGGGQRLPIPLKWWYYFLHIPWPAQPSV